MRARVRVLHAGQQSDHFKAFGTSNLYMFSKRWCLPKEISASRENQPTTISVCSLRKQRTIFITVSATSSHNV